jgi:PAS domain S-box-containing protein
MKDEEKSKEQLIRELNELRNQVAALEARSSALHAVEPTCAEKVEVNDDRAIGVWAADKNDVIGMICAVETVAARQKTGDTLAEREARLRSSFDSSFIGIAITSVNKEWLEVNDKLCQMLGYSRQELTAMTWDELTHPEDLEADVVLFNQVLHGQIDSYKLEKRFIRKDGNIITTTIWLNCKRNPNRKVDYFIAFLEDITEKKALENRLKESEQKYRAIFEQAVDSIVLIDAQTLRFVDFNEPTYKYLDYSKEEFERLTLADIEALESPVAIQKHIEKIIRQENDCFETKHKTKNGQIRDVQVRSRHIRIGGRHYLIAILRDITENNLLLSRLKQSEEIFRSLFEQAPLGIAIINSSTFHYYQINQAYCDIVGYTKDALANKTFVDITHHNDIQSEISKMKLLSSGQLNQFSMEKQYIRKDGLSVWCNLTCVSLWSGQGGSSYHIAMLEDITERKQYESLLENSHIQLSTILDAVDAAIYVVDIQTFDLVFINQYIKNIVCDNFSGKKCWQVIQSNQAGICENCYLKKLLNADGKPEAEYASEVKTMLNGRVYFVNKKALKWLDGRFVALFVAIDITERKRLEQELVESEMRFRLFAENAPDVLWIVNAQNVKEIIYLSPSFEQMSGYSTQQALNESIFFTYLVYPEDRLKHASAFNEFLDYNQEYRCEYRIVAKDGNIKWVLERGFKIADRQNNINWIGGITEDITERKQVETIINKELVFQSAVAKLTEALLNPYISVFDISKIVNNEALALTQSPHGFTSIIDEQTGDNVSISLTEMLGKECKVSHEKQFIRLPKGIDGYNALWGHSLNTGRGFYTNTAKKHTAYKNCAPVGHIEIERYLSVPAKSGDTIIGQIAVANASKDYTEYDLSIIARLASIYAIAIERKKIEEKIKEINITLEKRIAEAIDKSRLQEQLLIQQSKMASMGETIGMIAHQWRQPLNAVAMLVQDIKLAYEYGELSEDYLSDSVKTVKEQVAFMSNTIEVFREFLTPSKQKTVFNIRRVVDEILLMFKEMFRKYAVDIIVADRSDERELTIWGYPNEFKQVILNIIINAKDAIVSKRLKDEKEFSGLIKLSFSETQSSISVFISDNGGGIPDHVIDKIFMPYFTTKTSTQGTGVGLYMSKTIIEVNMGGLLTVQNTHDGAEFCISMPKDSLTKRW